ncbi:MAG: lysophospholipid acyltransferase family protein [Caulobacteraceae bacterium]
MIVLRSLLFAGLFYLWSAAITVGVLPLLAGPRRYTIQATRVWARGVLLLLRAVCGIAMEVRGLEHLPAGAALIGAKHQCMFDTMGPITVFADACYVMKRELLRIPVYGWYCRKAGMIAIDRQGGAGALRALVAAARDRLTDGRQIVIFPEGSRMAPGVTGAYKPGVAALYRDLAVPCVPMATNSGAHWPAHGFLRRPGTIVYQFLEPIPAGLRRTEFMRLLQERIEGASAALLAEDSARG